MKEVNVSQVLFRDDLYPRLEKNPTIVQKYAEDLDVLPPIEINQRSELIDGWHRWTAHKKVGAEKIRATVTETGSDGELLELAIQRNAAHGLQLSQEDKRDVARRIYHATPERERDRKKKDLTKILSVSDRTIRDWLSRIDKDSKEARNRRIFELWLACYTQEEIAEREGIDRTVATRLIQDFVQIGNLAESHKASAAHATDFDPPIYNVWKFKEKTPGSNHFGNTEPTILDNLLYLYTDPLDTVVDPFAGGGSTRDLCRKRFRRYWVSDRKVQPELEEQIREHDLTTGLPPLHRWDGVRLVYLDPPYWWQARGSYSQDPEDLGNMDLDQFHHTLAGIINGFAKKLKAGASIALIIQPTQWNAPAREFTDHVAAMLKAVDLPIEMRFSCPYESQQANAQMVEWAKQERRCLVLTRELIVWRCP